MRNRLFVHPYQLDDQIFFAVLTLRGKTFYRHIDLCLRLDQAREFRTEIRSTPFCLDDWVRLDQVEFLGCLNWTPYILLTDLANPYSLRIATQREQAYRLTCAVGSCTFVHPTHFTTESQAVIARRAAQSDLGHLADWDLIDDTAIPTECPRFEVHRDDAVTYRIEMVAPAAIYRHPDTFSTYEKATTAYIETLHQHGRANRKGRASIADPARLIQALDGESEPWEYDPQARKTSRPYSFFNLGIGQRTRLWVDGFALWNRTRFPGTAMLQKGATIRVQATPSLYRDKIQWRVRDFQLVRPAMHTIEAE